jgi:hypothetical protein
MKKSIRENLKSKVNLINSRYIILKLHYIVNNLPLSFANRVVVNKRPLYY